MECKNLIFISGTMGAGKTSVAKQLLEELPACVMLDGDWCWTADPFIVNDETKEMVTENITYLLAQFLNCSAYKNVVFCWVMDHQSIADELLMRLQEQTESTFHFYHYSLVLSPEALTERLTRDIELGCVSKVTNRENYASQRKAAAKWRKARYLQASFSKRIAILRQSLILIKKHSTRCLSL